MTNIGTRLNRQSRGTLIVCLDFNYGGGEVVPIFLANWLTKRRKNVNLMVMRNSKVSPNVGLRNLLDDRVKVFHYDEIRTNFTDFLVENKIDVINSHQIGFEVRVLNDHGLKKEFPPLVLSMHGGYEQTTQHSKNERFVSQLLRWCKGITYLREKNLSWIPGELKTSLDIVRVRNPHVKRRVSKVESYYPQNSLIRSATVDRKIDGDLNILIVSRAILEKGWGIVIEAMSKASSLTGTNIQLRIIGTGPIYEKTRLSHNSDSWISFLGDQDFLTPHYTWADFTVLMSSYEGESLPMTLVDSLCYEVPIIYHSEESSIKALTNVDEPPGYLMTALNIKEQVSRLTEILITEVGVERNIRKKKYSKMFKSFQDAFSEDRVYQTYEDLLFRVHKRN